MRIGRRLDGESINRLLRPSAPPFTSRGFFLPIPELREAHVDLIAFADKECDRLLPELLCLFDGRHGLSLIFVVGTQGKGLVY